MQGERRERGHLRAWQADIGRDHVHQGGERVRLGHEEDRSGGRDDCGAAAALRRQLALHRLQEAAPHQRLHGEEKG